jgi:hypothetical protein
VPGLCTGTPRRICVEIRPAALDSDEPGWRLLHTAPVKFARRKSMRPMAKPSHGGDIDMLRMFLMSRPKGT